MKRVALVTGAASGIGAATASRLSEEGWDVFGVDLRDADLRVEGIAADLTTRDGNAAAVAATVERFGRLDAVIANAGFQHVAPVEEMPEERWDAIIALSYHLPAGEVRLAPPRRLGQGRFVAIASVHALTASPFKAPYVSAKHGVLGLVKTLALEGAPHGISATAVCPAYVRTPLVEDQIADQARAHGISEERVLEEVILARQAVKRLIEPGEVAGAVSFLLGPDGAAFSGTPFTMDQGWTAG